MSIATRFASLCRPVFLYVVLPVRYAEGLTPAAQRTQAVSASHALGTKHTIFLVKSKRKTDLKANSDPTALTQPTV